MKTLISILIGLLVVGCGKKDVEASSENTAVNDSKVIPKGLKEEDVLGAYISVTNVFPTVKESYVDPEAEKGTRKIIFLENGLIKMFFNGKISKTIVAGKNFDNWKIKGSEIWVQQLHTTIYGIKQNGDLIEVGFFNGEVKLPHAMNERTVYKKIKSEKETPSKGDGNNSTTAKPVKELTLREKVIGTYEIILLDPKGFVVRAIFLDNGIVENYNNGKKVEVEFKWEIVDGELHILQNEGNIGVSIINKDSSQTYIAEIDKDGKRTDVPKNEQMTFKRIK